MVLVYDNATVATAKDKNGEILKYSVKQYVINLFGKTAEELDITEGKFTQLKTLLSDMLVYGAQAQKSIGYKTNALVNENLYDADGNPITLTPSTFDSSTITTVDNSAANNSTIKSAGLNISHVNKIYFRLLDTVDMQNAQITITVGESNVDYTVQGNLVYTDEIIATAFDTVYTITVVSGETTSVIHYSVNTYIAAKYDSNSVGDICKALYNYGQSATTYVNA